MRVLTWNLFHGRAVPEVHRDLEAEFAAAIAGWDWDVALLQEVPPWWPPVLARAAGAEFRLALTSRNCLLPLRRWVAERRPDLIKSNGGGCNAILVRPGGPAGRAIALHRVGVLRRRPERRVVHAVRLEGGPWIANLHAQVRPHELTRADLRRAGELVLGWAGRDARVLLGGDCNVVDPVVPGFDDLGGHGVDRVLGRGFAAAGRAATPPRAGGLSDHAPVVLDVAPRCPASAARSG